MVRPRARQVIPSLDRRWRYIILDGYVDEPAALGVPPYLSPQARSLAGGLSSGGAEEDDVGYITVDGWRGLRGEGKDISTLPRLEVVICINGCVVPGKYLRGEPISHREMEELARSLVQVPLIICGPASSGLSIEGAQVIEGDLGVLGRGISSEGCLHSRRSTLEEWDSHLLEGAFIIRKHPDFPSPLIVELETARGCVRYVSGGCSFCSEPGKGPITFREPEMVIRELESLSEIGLENVRIGGQSDLISYMSPDVGRDDHPRPDPSLVNEMMMGVRSALHKGKGIRSAEGRGLRCGIDCGIIHTDNANPAVISAHPEESKEVLRSISKYATSGSVLALGLESSDPVVHGKNNLNSTADETLFAVKMMNEVGGKRGPNGLPSLLPGLNFLGGLPGETGDSFRMDLDLLRTIYEEGLSLRRINIRAALFPQSSGGSRTVWEDGRTRSAFRAFKAEVRERWDPLFMDRLVPVGTRIRGIYIETSLGRTHFGRQIGSYPILIGIPHTVDVGTYRDVIITEIGARSLTGVTTPVRLNKMSPSDLQGIPGVGRKRAATLFRKRPKTIAQLKELVPDLEWLEDDIILE